MKQIPYIVTTDEDLVMIIFANSVLQLLMIMISTVKGDLHITPSGPVAVADLSMSKPKLNLTCTTNSIKDNITWELPVLSFAEIHYDQVI